jgi:hypothetical protein
MVETKIDNELYYIGIDFERNWMYFTLKTAYTEHETDQNITSNFLSMAYEYMNKRFKLILDLSTYDPRVKPQKYEKRMKDIGKRLEELEAGPQVHVMNDIHWYNTYQRYPEHEGEYPLVVTDEITKELIGRFNTIEEGENWLLSL